MAKVIVNKRANIYHDNGNNKVDFEDNLYRILSRNREYVKKLLSGEKIYPDIPLPIPSGYIYPTSYSESSNWAELMTEPYSTEHTTAVSFEQEGKVATMDATDFFGYDNQPCVAVINCDIGDTAGVTLSAKLLGMVGGYLDQSESWENISNVFSAELAFLDSSATLTFTTDEDVTINSITVYYTESEPPVPPTPPTPDYITSDSTTDADHILTPIETPTAETEAAEVSVTGWTQEGYEHWIYASDASTGAVGGYVLFDIDLGDDNYKLLAQGVNENAYSSGDLSSQIFTPDDYTVEVFTNATGSYNIKATDGNNQLVEITINSVVKYTDTSTPSSYITASSIVDTTNSLAPLVTPSAETEAEEEYITNKFSQDGNNVEAGIYDTCLSVDGGYLLLEIEINGNTYTLLAQSIKNEGYSYGAAIHQYFTAGSYTVDVSGEETYDSPHLIISAVDEYSQPVEVLLDSAKRYFGVV